MEAMNHKVSPVAIYLQRSSPQAEKDDKHTRYTPHTRTRPHGGDYEALGWLLATCTGVRVRVSLRGSVGLQVTLDGCGSDVKTAADGGGGTLLPGDCCRRRYVEPTLL